MYEGIKILCVDDEKNVLKSLERLFMDCDFEFISATSGEEGLEILKNGEEVQLIISDYRMPVMNGVDFLKEVYRIWPDTVRIVLSGYADTVSIVEAINEGHIYKFIPKPWNDDELKVTISKALDYYLMKMKNRQLTNELEQANEELLQVNSNLEKLVEERTAEIMLQNRILTNSQNILDALPVGVVGVDPEGTIVQCNEKGLKFFDSDGGHIMGLDRSEAFPAEINAFMERVIERGSCAESVRKDGSVVAFKGVHMNYSNGQEGIILVFDEVSDDGQ